MKPWPNAHAVHQAAYLNSLDQFVKRTLGARHYLRYVDDFVLWNTDADQLRNWEQAIRVLPERLLLQAHERTQLRAVSDGVDFLGYMIRPDYLLPRRRVVSHAKERIDALERALVVARPEIWHRQLKAARIWPIDCDAIKALRATWASYLGHFKHANSKNLVDELWQEHPISRFYLRGLKPTRFARYQMDPSWSAQVRRLRIGIDDAVLIMKVGCYAQRPLTRDINLLGLRPTRLRGGRICAGLPWRRMPELVNRALAKGKLVALALEEDWSTGKVKRRRLSYFIKPIQGKLGGAI